MVFAATDYGSVIGGVLAILLGGTGIAGLLAARKVKPEAEAIAVGTIASVNKELRTELERQVALRVAAEELAEKRETERQELLATVRKLQRQLEGVRLELLDVEARLDERGQ